MDSLKNLIINFFELANAMSIYIIIGLIIAGILKEILPNDFISKHLGKSNYISVIKATILGIPMPVCSCSVIPLAKSLQKEGASRGAVQSFLISTPITGVDSILATYSFFGWIFTIYRVITSIIIAVVAGILQNIFDKKQYKNSNFSLKKQNINKLYNIKTINTTTINFNGSKCTSKCCSSSTKDSFNIFRVFKYAFNTLFSDIAKALFYGLIIGAIFSTFLPKETISNIGENLFLTYIIILIISMPLYVCATSSLPIGASLILSGLPLGAAFVFLSAGPATNSVTMSVVKDMFGKKGLFIYIGVIASFSIIFAYILDTFMGSLEITKQLNHTQSFGIINYISTAVMLTLIAYYWRRK